MKEGTKFDQNKPGMHLLPMDALLEIAKVLDYGANKYEPHNWRKGMHYSRVYSACLRHLTAWSMGEDKDPETDISHLAHAACNILFLLWYSKHRTQYDDRYKEENNGKAKGVVDNSSNDSSVDSTLFAISQREVHNHD